jgi:hypothetical protein
MLYRESACEHLGGLGPLVWEEIENAQTVHKPKLKFIYRYIDNNQPKIQDIGGATIVFG